MLERAHEGFVVADFDSMSDGQRLLRAPSVNGVIQINTHKARDSNPLLSIDKSYSNIFVTRQDELPIQVAIGGYNLVEENLGMDDTKAVVNVFEQPSPEVRFVNLDGLWLVDPESARAIHPNRAKRFAMVLGSCAIVKPVMENTTHISNSN